MEEINIEQESIAAAVFIEIERIELNTEPSDKGKTHGCWGPSPDDNRNQC